MSAPGGASSVRAVEASAGTGKTHRIGEMVVAHVIEGVPIERIVLSSYTNAAADELAARVRAALSGALQSVSVEGSAHRPPTPAESALLRRALADLDRACIGTIHSFCARLLEDAAEVAGGLSLDGLSPDARAGDLLSEVVADAWAAIVAPSPVAIWLLGESGPEARKRLAAIAVAVDGEPDADLDPPPDMQARLPIQRDLDALLEDRDAADALRRLSALAEHFLKKDGHASAIAGLAFVGGRSGAGGLAALAALPALREDTGRERWSAGAAKDRHAREALDAWSASGGASVLSRMRAIDAACEAGRAPFRSALASRLRAALKERRSAHRTYSYGDLVDRAWQLVRTEGSPLVRHARARFRVAILDECQDTDPVQQAVFRRIFDAPDRTLRVVGDPKQSIYGFRGADLNSYVRLAASARQDAPLSVSRRSDASHVAAVEGLFTGHPLPFGDDRIAFAPVTAKHEVPRCRWAGGRPASGIEVIWLEGDALVEAQRRAAVDAAATRIRQWIEPGGAHGLQVPVAPEDPAVLRQAGPGDIAVLCQARTDLDMMRAALDRLGVPSVLAGDSSVLLSPAAEDMHAILHACASVRAVPAALGAALGAALTRALGATSEEAQQQRDEWVAALRECARAMRRDGVDAALVALLERPLPQARTGPRQGMSAVEILLAQPGGERHAVDLIHLRELLSDAQRRGVQGPEALLQWLRAERAGALAARGRGGDAARRIRTQATRDAVVLQTLHSSKGLTYPVVVLPTIAIGAEEEGRPNPLHAALEGDGHAVRVIDMGSARWPARAHAHVHGRTLERRRLLYVAVTRARHLTCICMHDVPAKDRLSALDELLVPAGGPARCDQVRAWQARASEALRRIAPDHAAGLEPVRIEAVPVPWSGPPPAPAAHVPLCAADPPVERWAEPLREHSFTSLSRASAPGHHGRASPDFVGAREPDEPRVAGIAGDASDAPATVAAAGPVDAAIRQLGMAGAELGVVLHAALDRAFHALGADAQPRVAPRAAAADAPRPLADSIEQEIARLRPADAGTRAAAHAADAALRAALSQPLQMGCPSVQRLAAQRDAVLREFQVSVPLAGRRDDIARAFAAHGGALGAAVARRIASAPALRVDGILHGIIDVAARGPAGGWHIIDWKSNDLGKVARGYEGPALEAAVVESLYPLQAAIYVTILGRWLGRVEPSAHVAAAHYLFLRGMDARAPGRGIWTWSPPAPLRAALESLVDAAMPSQAGGGDA